MTDSDAIFREFRNWCIVVDKNGSNPNCEAMTRVLEEIELIYLQMSRLDASSLGSVADTFSVLDIKAQFVDRLWINCLRYQTENLSHLLDLIAIKLQRFIYEEIETVKLLEGFGPSRTVS
jgi:hypothetical protein